MQEIIDEYAYTESAIFAIALSELLNTVVTRVTAYELPVHSCCTYRNLYLDAYGLSTEEQLIKRSCPDLQNQIISIKKVVVKNDYLKRYTTQEIEQARAAAVKLVNHLKLTPIPKHSI